MRCNIDQGGRRVRRTIGYLCITIGALLLLAWAIPGGGWVAWVVTTLLLAAGAFAIFEARRGWCAVRAMGFRTPV